MTLEMENITHVDQDIRPILNTRREYPFHELSYALAEFAASSEWETQPQPLMRWSCSTIEVAIGSGSGQRTTPFSISLKEFVRVRAEVGFSSCFLGKLIGKRSMF